MPICIAGMHRSGTSMVAKVLHDAGLYLGEDADLKGPSQHNQDGFWEHRRIIEFNEEILNALGGGWDCPPPMPEGWTEAVALRDFMPRVEGLLQQFVGREPWGWKDPRNSLTLPFWLDCLPDAKVVICLRNPLEVALSLRRRNILSYALSITLWQTYNERALRATAPERRLITHYDAYARDPRREVRRVLAFAGLPLSEEVVERAAAATSDDLRHYRFTTGQLLDAEVAPEVLDLYLRMCAEAGWGEASPSEASAGRAILVGRRAAGPPDREGAPTMELATPSAPGEAVGRLDRSVLDVEVLRRRLDDAAGTNAELRARIGARDAAIGDLRTRIDQRDAVIGELRTRLDERGAMIVALRDRLEKRSAVLGELRAQFSKQQARIDDLRSQLETERRRVAEMAASWGWRLSVLYGRAHDRVERRLRPPTEGPAVGRR